MAELLTVRNVTAGYGATVVLDQVSFAVETGTTLAILGRNGVGKTTLLTTILGHTTQHDGSINFAGQPIEQLKPLPARQAWYRHGAAGAGDFPLADG